MPDAIHRTTLDVRRSAHRPNLDPADWVIDPDLSAVAGVPRRYWKVQGDLVLAMSPAERAAIDAAILAAAKADKIAELQEERRYALEIVALAAMTPAQVRAAIDADIATVNAETGLRAVRAYRTTLLRQRATRGQRP